MKQHTCPTRAREISSERNVFIDSSNCFNRIDYTLPVDILVSECINVSRCNEWIMLSSLFRFLYVITSYVSREKFAFLRLALSTFVQRNFHRIKRKERNDGDFRSCELCENHKMHFYCKLNYNWTSTLQSATGELWKWVIRYTGCFECKHTAI